MQWKDEYNIGVEIIDEQHKKLAEMIAKLKSVLSSNEKNRQMGETLKFLVDYTNYHFTAEEELLQRVDYPQYSYHKGLHKKFSSKITAVLMKLKKGEPVEVIDLTDFLTDWLINHILDEDKKIGDFVIHHQQTTGQTVAPDDFETSLFIRNKLTKLKKLYDQDLIYQEEYGAKKREVMDNYFSGNDVNNNEDVEERLGILESLRQSELISIGDEAPYKSELLKKLNFSEKLEAIAEIEDKLKYLKSLLQDNLISEKEFENLKSNVLERL